MVVNLCLPHFSTTAHCNKLCADGYDVTNLVSADPVLRRRGFKLEYFLRPPLQVTLKFGFQVELCRIDVELWPWGMDRGQACKRLEISTSSDSWPTTDHKQTEQTDQVKVKDQKEKSRVKQPKDGCKYQQSNGHHWSHQAQQSGEEVSHDHQRRGHVFKRQTNTESTNSEPEFKLVARCELKEETHICFRHSNFRPRLPFLSPPPPQPANCRQEDLWSRGLLSLGAVTQLRVTVPFGGAASSLGLKALTVWGQPARYCPAEEVERIKRIHQGSERRLTRPVFSSPSVRQTTEPLRAPPSVSIPEEFLDPITQEVMMLPMLLPSGVSVDNTTLDEYRKREASWGRPPNDPFTGVSFSSTSQPLPNPQLKSRIDHFLLQKGMMRRDGMVGRQDQGDNPQASRLVASNVHGQSPNFPCLIENSMNNSSLQFSADNRDTRTSAQIEDPESGPSSNNLNVASNVLPLCPKSKPGLDRRKKRDLRDISKETEESACKKQLLPQTKRPRNDSVSASSCSTHEKRLSASLDEALLSALKGRPSFTSNLPDQREGISNSDPQDITEQSESSGSPSTSAGEKVCSACSCSVSVYSTAALSIYRLSCGHLLCRPCLQKESEQPRSAATSTSSFVLCPACKIFTARAHIIRVHH